MILTERVKRLQNVILQRAFMRRSCTCTTRGFCTKQGYAQP